MATDCDHQKTTITLDDGTERDVCLICDDVHVETLDDDGGAASSERSGTRTDASREGDSA